MSNRKKLPLKSHCFSRKTTAITVITTPRENDLIFGARAEPEKGETASAEQNHQSLGSRTPEIQKTRNTEVQETSNMSCSTKGEGMSQGASEPKPVIQWKTLQKINSTLYKPGYFYETSEIVLYKIFKKFVYSISELLFMKLQSSNS